MTEPRKFKKINEQKPWRLREDYNAGFYAFLARQALSTLKSLAQTNEGDKTEEKKRGLRKLGITKVLSGGWKTSLDKCVRYQVHNGIISTLKYSKEYIECYKTQFERDVAEGKVIGAFGSQREISFSGALIEGKFYRKQETLREDMKYVHSVKR